MKERDLTRGSILPSLLLFALPMLAGNLMQQAYNIADTLIVGRALGAQALAAVGSAYSLMTFLTSLVIGLCMGSGALISNATGARDTARMKQDVLLSAILIFGTTAVLMVLVILGQDSIYALLQIPDDVLPLMKPYTGIVLYGIVFSAVYNFYAYLVRSQGNSVAPMLFLVAASLINIMLDLWFVCGLGMGIEGAAKATVIAQCFSAIGLMTFTMIRYPRLRIDLHAPRQKGRMRFIIMNDIASGLQQSVMNLGILMIQGLVNTFGTSVMAAFSICVKIDTLAYMPAQEFGNAYSLFISQNHGANQTDRIKKGSKAAIAASSAFCVAVSILVFFAGDPLIRLFLRDADHAILVEGCRYLRIEGACYIGIGILFLLYGYFRGIQKPQVSLWLTIISLGTRVAVSYAFAPLSPLGVAVIWFSIPLGWLLADLTGLFMMKKSHPDQG